MRIKKIIKGKNYFCVRTHNYAGVEWIKGTKYYASDNYTLVNQGCEYYCPEYSKEEHNNLFEEVKYDNYVEKQNEQKPVDKVKPIVVRDFNSVFSREQIEEIDKRIEESQRLYNVKLRDSMQKTEDFPMTD